MKKVLAISVVVLLVALTSLGSVFAADDVVIDFVKGGAEADFVEANKEGPNGFFGPYWGDTEEAVTMNSTDGVIIDLAEDNAWLTLEVSPQEAAMTKYAIITAKTDDPSAINGFTMTFGTGPNAETGKDSKVGKLWADWGLEPLTTEYQTYVVDLGANGVTKVAAANGPDFALNRGEATGGKIYVKSIVLSDNKDATASSDNSGASSTDKGTSDNTANNNSSNNSNSGASNSVLSGGSNNSSNTSTTVAEGASSKTDADTGVEGIAMAVAATSLAVAGLVVSKRKIK